VGIDPEAPVHAARAITVASAANASEIGRR
jgi:hypothetical protein